MEKLLKCVAKDYFEKPKLDEKKLMELEDLLAATDGSAGKRNRHLNFLLPLILIISGLVFFIPNNTLDMQHEIAQEVAKNHIKMKPLEISTASMVDVRHHFSDLNFVPASSDYFSRFGNTLLGARYCSIQGITAAQLRFSNMQGEKITLYEIAYDRELFGPIPSIENADTPAMFIIKGMRVTLWREKGLLLASVIDLPITIR